MPCAACGQAGIGAGSTLPCFSWTARDLAGLWSERLQMGSVEAATETMRVMSYCTVPGPEEDKVRPASASSADG